MIVMKFGGSSVSSKDSLEALANQIQANFDRDPVIVVSAFSGITKKLKEYSYLKRDKINSLPRKEYSSDDVLMTWVEPFYREIVDFHRNFSRSLDIDFDDLTLNMDLINAMTSTDPNFERTRDLLMSFGERFSAKIVAKYLSNRGIYSDSYNSYDLGLRTDDNYGNAFFKRISYDNIAKSMRNLNSKNLPVITGFIGKTDRGEITTMGPNSSDDTAVIFGVALDAEEILAYKNVDGVLTANPRLVQNPRNINYLSYEEAAELSSSGSDVMNSIAIMLAALKNKKIKVVNILNPDKFTLINEHRNNSNDALIKGIASKEDNIILSVESPLMVGQEGYAARIYDKIASRHRSLDVLTSSGIMISSTIDPYEDDRKRKDSEKDLSGLERSLAELGEVNIERGFAIISLVGSGLVKNPNDILSRTSKVMNDNNIRIGMVSLSYNSRNLRITINQDNEKEAVQALHDEFFN